MTDDMYIYKRDDKYEIRKSHNHTTHYYGRYPTLDEARKIRDKLIENNWNTTKVRINRKYRPHGTRDRHIHKHGQYHYIERWTQNNDGTRELTTYDHGIKTIREARQLRDWWEEHDWDMSSIDLD